MLKCKIKNIYKKKMKKQGVRLVKMGEMKAVHDKDLQNLLRSLGVYNDVLDGRATCEFCKGTINIENIEAVFPFNNEVSFCCNNYSCYKMLTETIQGD